MIFKVESAPVSDAEFKASDTGYVDAAELELARRDMTADEYAQEYECSFEAAIKGSIDAGQVRALATTGDKRSTVMPDLPTVNEAGVPGYDATIWLGIMAPKGTPNAIVDRLNAEIIKAIAAPAMKEAWAKQGAVPMTMTPAEFGVYLEKDIAKWADVIKKADIKLQ